jgi:hypothetical protein
MDTWTSTSWRRTCLAAVAALALTGSGLVGSVANATAGDTGNDGPAWEVIANDIGLLVGEAKAVYSQGRVDRLALYP